ncbi:MAG: helix-turn-helix transcriptional regulator [bacterium]|nr:helix-turn-helix transcriptional regulator [bacterium]
MMAGGIKCGKRLKAIRETLGYNQTDFARLLGISGGGISEPEHGKYPPRVATIERLARDFKVNLYYFILGEGEMFATAKKQPGKDPLERLMGNVKPDREQLL